MSKQHISSWIKNSNLKECEINMKSIGCNSRSDYIDKVVEFYNGYIHNKNNEDYVNKNVVNTVQALLDSFEKRMARLMFKQSVEISKIFWLIVKEMEIEPEDADTLHASCVDEVKKINGAMNHSQVSRHKKAQFFRGSGYFVCFQYKASASLGVSILSVPCGLFVL